MPTTMARTLKIIEAPRLNDLVTSQGTTPGLISLVNTYLATLVDPLIVGWSLNARVEAKRMSIQWMFTVISEPFGPALVNPFTLNILQNTSLTDLQVAVDALYAAALPAQYVSPTQITKLDSDLQGFAKQYVAATLRNALAAAVDNASVSSSQAICSGLVAAVQASSRYAVNAQGGAGQAAEADATIMLPRGGVIRNLSAYADAAVGGGATVTVSVRLNGASVISLAFTNADGTTLKNNPGGAAVTVGDLITFSVTCDNAGAPAANFNAAVEFI